MAADGKEDIPDYDLSRPAAPLGRVTELVMASCFGVVGLALVAIASGFPAPSVLLRSRIFAFTIPGIPLRPASPWKASICSPSKCWEAGRV